MSNNYLVHHGILGQKWGTRNGPPYPLGGGDYTDSERKAIYIDRHAKKNSIYNKKHFDETLKKGTVLNTLSWNPDRTKDTDMFFASHTKLDTHQYRALFNKPMTDDSGHRIYKWKIKNVASTDIKVASEDSAANEFRKLYKSDRDFYNFVTDPERMEKQLNNIRYMFKGYRQAKATLQKFRDEGNMTADDLQTIYRIFNYVIPSDGAGDARAGKDVATQRAKFFKALSEAGYGAVLDTNDAIYGGFKAQSPIIVFDQSKIIPESVTRSNMVEQKVSALITAGRKALGV